MMVTFVSQREKNALKKTRRVLDAFANRIGDNTWQTVITEEGLLTVKKMLRQTASKNTAVSCHWIRSRARSQLLWVVGKKDKFNAQGYVPVNTTRKNLLTSDSENDWQYLPLIKALVAVAALLHDWGKATKLFQDKLNPKKKVFKGDPIRHEWISLLLLHALVSLTKSKSDADWLTCFSQGEINEEQLKSKIQQPPPHPFAELPPMAKLVAWLIVSHHRLPLPKSENCRDYLSEHAKSLDALLARVSQQWSYENRYDEAEYQQRVDDCFVFPKGLLSQSQPWIRQLKKWSKRLLDHQQTAEKIIEDGSYRVVISHARLCLMLGDHLFSSEKEKNLKWQGALDLHPNTYIDPQTQQRSFKQKLDEHLVGVAQKALDAAHLLPAFEQELPSAGNLKRLSQASPKDFKWQDKAIKKIHQWRKVNDETKKYGCFVVNLASTGCGKTFANAKVMRALSNDGKSLRCILALGLRTLTLQTGDEYRKRIFGASNHEEKQKSKRELAVLIGSRAVMELHQQNIIDQEKNSYESSGSASKELLLEEELDTDFDSDIDCDIPERMLTTILKQERDKQFLYAPLLT